MIVISKLYNLKNKNKERKIGSMIFLIMAIIILVLLVIYRDSSSFIPDWHRIFWLLTFTFFGVSAAALDASKKYHDDKPSDKILFQYFSRYLIVAIAISSLLYGVLTIFDLKDNFHYYFISAPLGLAFGYTIDIFVSNLHKLVSDALVKNK